MMRPVDQERHRIVHILAGEGWSPERIAPPLGMSRRTVYRVLAAYRRAKVQAHRDLEEYCRDKAG